MINSEWTNELRRRSKSERSDSWLSRDSSRSWMHFYCLSYILFIAHVLFVTSSVESSAVIKIVSTSHISHLPFFSDSTELLCIFCIKMARGWSRFNFEIGETDVPELWTGISHNSWKYDQFCQGRKPPLDYFCCIFPSSHSTRLLLTLRTTTK